MYVMLEVQLHNVEGTPKEICNRVREILASEFQPDYDSDLLVEIVEHTTST